MERSAASRYERQRVQHYAREVRPQLPKAVFQKAPSRLLWLPLHLAIILSTASFVVLASPPWYLALFAAVIAGHSWGCLGFLAHEAMHHALLKNRTLEKCVGYLGFGIYCLSPTLWTAWHNQAHHGNTANWIADPDGFVDLGFWKKNRLLRELEKLSPGSGHKQSALFLFIWFPLHSLLVLFFHSQQNGYYTRISRRQVYTESAAMLAFWVGVLFLVGPYPFLFVYVVPMLIGSATIMSYIATNHFLNPFTKTNDPLANSLSVTGPRWLERFHLNFGYHVEHHLFPAMSARHAPAVRDVLRSLYGERYLSMPHTRALRLVYTRPKLHDSADTLVDPETMTRFNTLAPGNLSMQSLEPELSPVRVG